MGHGFGADSDITAMQSPALITPAATRMHISSKPSNQGDLTVGGMSVKSMVTPNEDSSSVEDRIDPVMASCTTCSSARTNPTPVHTTTRKTNSPPAPITHDVMEARHDIIVLPVSAAMIENQSTLPTEGKLEK